MTASQQALRSPVFPASAVPAWPRRVAIGSVLAVAGTVFALSFVAISEVSVEVGAVNGGMGWLVPIAIDGGIIAGCMILWAQAAEGRQRRQRWRPSLFVAALLALSVWVNVEHTDDGGLLAQVIAGSPPVILFGALELVADQFRRRDGRSPESPAVTGVTETVTAVTSTVTGLADGTPVDPADLVETSARLKVTERARRTLDAYVRAGGDSSDNGLAQAIAARIGCHPRTAYRVIREHDQGAVPAHTQNGHWGPPGELAKVTS